jgi:peptidoglycan/xylan/chitin deacetylase (PgdA/CDA1 family)
VLLDASRGEEVVISSRVEISLETLPAVWSPDSRFVVYAKAGGLYYFALPQLQQGRVLTESLRRIGDGSIGSVRWASSGDLYYVSGSVIFAIDPSELFTRALYSGFLSIGRIAGRLPLDFDSVFDSFWVSPDGKRILLDKGGRNLFVFEMKSGDFHDSSDPAALPYLYLPRDTRVRKVLWSAANVLTVLCQSRNGGKTGSTIFRLAPDADGRLSRFQKTPETDVRDVALSPGEGLVALMRASDVAWKDYATWKDIGRAGHPSPLRVLWLSDDELLIAGAWFTEKRSILSGESALIALSQISDAGYAVDSGTILASTPSGAYSFSQKTGSWKRTSGYAVRDRSVASDSYRVYLEASSRGSYENLIMVRDAKGYGTASLVPAQSILYEAFPAEDQAVDFSNFTHGSRIRRREVSLVFNAVDSVEGLTGILDTLSAYGLRSTFFVNGEFIRRYPAAVKEIADSGHEVGSLFSMYFNMTDSRYTVDAAFIKAGLAKTEDDYNAATGRELSLLWHAPYYIVNSDIIAAARQMNYAYVGRDLDTYDWVSRDSANRAMGIYQPAADLVERIIAEKKPGSIIPILVGTGDGKRDDYLFQDLDLVVNELVRLGYSIVPVSTLIEHAR